MSANKKHIRKVATNNLTMCFLCMCYKTHYSMSCIIAHSFQSVNRQNNQKIKILVYKDGKGRAITV